MKKFAALLLLVSLGAFTIGCDSGASGKKTGTPDPSTNPAGVKTMATPMAPPAAGVKTAAPK
jgi:hypothetical protein